MVRKEGILKAINFFSGNTTNSVTYQNRRDIDENNAEIIIVVVTIRNYLFVFWMYLSIGHPVRFAAFADSVGCPGSSGEVISRHQLHGRPYRERPV